MKRTALKLAIALFTIVNLGCGVARVHIPPVDEQFSASALVPLPPATSISPAPVPDDTQIGVASFYHPSLVGQLTANGDRYSDGALTAAHRTLGLGTRVRVTNLENLRSVVVTVNDRGPYVRGRIIDLSRRAARVLGFVHEGTTRVKVDPLT